MPMDERTTSLTISIENYLFIGRPRCWEENWNWKVIEANCPHCDKPIIGVALRDGDATVIAKTWYVSEIKDAEAFAMNIYKALIPTYPMIPAE